MYRRLVIICLIFILEIILSINIKFNDLNEIKKIKVEVRGYIDEQATYELDYGSTFNDLLDLIELKEDTDISSYSLNEVLYNDEIFVFKKKEEDIKLISINNATIEELMSLPGIGEITANKIIEYRNLNGSFKNINELINVNGIGNAKFERIKEYITL